ncbi:hypothetical protein ONZ45_g14068 [Pleurotus djamor]|nr:hypothetical protein ONZ45_g14068 [Pleurotus djamor]
MDATFKNLNTTMGSLSNSMDRLSSTVDRLSVTMESTSNSVDRLSSTVDQFSATVERSSERLSETTLMLAESMERSDRVQDERLARMDEREKRLNAVLKRLEAEKEEKKKAAEEKVDAEPAETTDQTQVIADLQRRLEALERKGESRSSVPRRVLFINSPHCISQPAPFIFTVKFMYQHIRTDVLAHQAIDEQIHALKIRRNTYCAISQLPDEILYRIFAFTKLNAELEQTFPFSRGRHQWMNSTVHVCRAWRNIGLNNPSLWTSIDLPAPHTMEMLFRSKSAPLRLFCKIPDDTNNGEEIDRNQSEFWLSAEAAFTDVTRIQEISIRGDTVQCSTLSRLFSLPVDFPSHKPTTDSPSPRLELLNIHIDHYITTAPPSRLLPWGELRYLRNLGLLGVPLPPVLPSMPNLRELKVGDTPNHPNSVTALLQLLSGTPNIMDISLKLYLTVALPDPATVAASIAAFPDRVILPRLGRLVIESNDITTCHIFDRLAYPTKASVHCFYHTATIGPLTDFSPLRRAYARYARSSFPPASSVPGYGKERFEISVSLTDSTIGVAIAWRKDRLHLGSLEVNSPLMYPQAVVRLPCTVEIYKSFRHIIPWYRVNVLSFTPFTHKHRPARVAFCSILRDCKDLEELLVPTNHVVVLNLLVRMVKEVQEKAKRAEEERQSGSTPTSTPRPLTQLSKLRHILLYSTSFEAPGNACSTYDALVALLRLGRLTTEKETTSSTADHSSWVGVTEVTLLDCTELSAEKLRTLSELITTFRWDKKGLLPESNVSQ